MEKQVIGRGLLAGALAAVPAFVFARIFVEPVISRAIEFEDDTSAAYQAMEHGSAGHGHEHGVELFTRGVQSNVGMGLGVLAFSVAMGALFAVVFCVVYGRVGNVSARMVSLLLAAGMFIALWAVPSVKYPPDPPATSLDETIRQRSMLYLLMVVLSAILIVAALYLGHQLRARVGVWNAALSGAGAYLVAVSAVMWLLPAIDEVPGPVRDDAGNIVFPGFPAADLYEFRLSVLATQAIIWATIGLVFGVMAARLLDGDRRESIAA